MARVCQIQQLGLGFDLGPGLRLGPFCRQFGYAHMHFAL